MLHRFPNGRERRRRCTRSGCRTARRRGSRPCGCTSRATAGTPTSCASPSWPSDLGGADVDRRVPPVELPPRRHRAARRVAHRPRPDAGVPVRHGAAGGPRGARGARRARRRPAGRRPPAARGCTSTSASSRDYGFNDVRRAALAFAREVERRAPDDVTTTWWRKDRDPASLFVDYNQNARDHTIAAAYSVRGVPDGDGVDADQLGRDRRRRARATSPSRPCRPASPSCGDLHAGIDDAVFSPRPAARVGGPRRAGGAVRPGRRRRAPDAGLPRRLGDPASARAGRSTSWRTCRAGPPPWTAAISWRSDRRRSEGRLAELDRSGRAAVGPVRAPGPDRRHRAAVLRPAATPRPGGG